MKRISHRRGLLLSLALIAITVTAYWPAMQSGGFIWDDADYVVQNKTLRDVEGLKDIWLSPRATPQYYPLVFTTYWVEFRLWGLNPRGYHVTNVLLHALACLLLWRVLRRLQVPGAWLVGAIFAAHPVHVESVAWITERKNVLSGVFYLGAALAYLRWAHPQAGAKRSTRVYITSILLFLCALLSKTVTATLPAALVLMAWWKDGDLKDPSAADSRPEIRRLFSQIVPLVPFFVVGLGLSLVTVILEKHHVGAKGAEWSLTFIDRGLIAGRALWFYVGKLLWPTGLCFNYPRWEIDAGVWWQWLYPLSFAAVVVAFWAARKRLGRGPLVGVLYFAGTLTPALGFFDVYPMRYSFVADHFVYLASIGLLALVAGVIVRASGLEQTSGPSALSKFGTAWGVRRSAGIGLSAMVLIALVILSRQQCKVYRGLEPLWLDTIEKNPTSFMAYNNLGLLYLHEGRPGEAIPLFEKSIQNNPRDLSAINNLGVALVELGRYNEAHRQYLQAIAIDQNNSQAYHNYGVALARQGQLDEAIEYYQKALAIDPDLAATHSNLGSALGELGRLDEAIRQHEEALAIDSGLSMAHLKYGETLQAAGRIREAVDQYRGAVALDPSLAAAHYHLGTIAVADQLLPAALDHFRSALEAAPDFAEAHLGMAKVLAAIGRVDQASQHFSKAVELAPQSGPIHLDYANFLAQHGDPSAARQEYLAAEKLMPNDPEPLFQAGVIDQRLGDTAAAEARFRKVLMLAPDHAQAHSYLAVLLAGQGNNEAAADLLRQAVRLAPENAEYHNNLGVILVRLHNYREGRKALEEAVRLNPDYEEARKNLNDLLNLMKKEGNLD